MLAGMYSVVVPFMSEAVQGVAETYKDMNVKLTGCATKWAETDDAICKAFDF